MNPVFCCQASHSIRWDAASKRWYYAGGCEPVKYCPGCGKVITPTHMVIRPEIKLKKADLSLPAMCDLNFAGQCEGYIFSPKVIEVYEIDDSGREGPRYNIPKHWLK